MDENMKRHDRPAGGSAARALAAFERKGIGGARAGTGSAASREGDVAGTAVETAETREIAADAETPPRGTKAPAVFRQVTVGKQSPSSASQQDSESTALSTDRSGMKPAEEGAHSLDATRLLSVEQLARAFSVPGKDRTDEGAASALATQPRHHPALSRENDQKQLRSTLPRVAGNDESTQYFRLSIPERGPIRGEPAPADDIEETQESPNPAVPAPRTPPQATHGMPHALVPVLVILNLGLTLLTLAANAYLVFHSLAGGR